MDWREEGILIGTRRYGENSVIVELFFKKKGRHLGVVRGGSSKKLNPILQLGNQLDAHWRARLEDHLGSFSIDLVKSRASLIMMDRSALAGLSSVCGLLNFCLPEREGNERLYDKTFNLLEAIASNKQWFLDYLSWELTLLEELGFGLDLSSCAVTGSLKNLKYISPKSARAVSFKGAGEWSNRLLPLPKCFLGLDYGKEDLMQGFFVTGYFLENKVASSIGQKLIPSSRNRLIELIRQFES